MLVVECREENIGVRVDGDMYSGWPQICLLQVHVEVKSVTTLPPASQIDYTSIGFQWQERNKSFLVVY
jgi:hypothetical protein